MSSQRMKSASGGPRRPAGSACSYAAEGFVGEDDSEAEGVVGGVSFPDGDVAGTALTELEHGADRDTAELLTAELVANAVEHTSGETPIELVVELMPSGCQVEVHDTDPQPPGELTCPSGGMPDPWQEHGRGLLLIRTLSSSCGHRPTESGKAVWFRLPVVPAQRRPSA
ncbi:hypothetical protein SVIOM74S_03166 [Streptomyces violarus]